MLTGHPARVWTVRKLPFSNVRLRRHSGKATGVDFRGEERKRVYSYKTAGEKGGNPKSKNMSLTQTSAGPGVV